jgi:solute carrier family 25 folate transporter 32
VWGAGSAWGLYFLFYNSLKTWWQGGDARKDLGATKHMTIAAEAGLLTLVATNPLWVVKTRLCLQYGGEAGAIMAAAQGNYVLSLLFSSLPFHFHYHIFLSP